MPTNYLLDPQENDDRRFLNYFRKSKEMFGRSQLDVKNRSGLTDSQTTVYRILAGTAPLTIGRAKRLTIASAKDLGFAWLPLWSYLSADRPDPTTQFSEIELATIEPADPAHAKGVAYAFRRHQRQASQIVWYSDTLPLALVPREFIRRKIGFSWPNLGAEDTSRARRFEERLARLQHAQLSEGCGTNQQVLIPIFSDQFELLVRKNPPFEALSAGDLRETVEFVIHDWTERNVLVVLIDSRGFPARLRKHFSRFHSVIAVGRSLLLRENSHIPGRLRYERTSIGVINTHIDLEIARLQELIQYREHELTKPAVMERLLKYLR